MKRNAIISFTVLSLGVAAFAQTAPGPVAPTPSPGNGFQPPRATPNALILGGGGFGGTYSGQSANYGTFGGAGVVSSSSSAVPPVVLRFSGGGEEANATIEEDLNVMSRLIERALEHGLGDDTPDLKMGIRMLYSEGGRSVRAIYLDGFGALFMIKVGFPVFAPNAAEPKEPPPAADTDWERAKKDLYGREEGRAAEAALAATGSKFDAEQVDELKQVLLQALKNASNIRQLKPDDFIAVTVFGHPSTVISGKKSRSKGQSLNLQPNADTPASETSAGRNKALDRVEQKTVASARIWDVSRTSSQGTVLTIRVRKSDADAFAKGKLDFDAFQKKVEQHSYAGSGYGMTSINSWSKPSSGALAR